MRAIYIYNPHSARERDLVQRAVQELRENVEEVEAVDFLSVRDIYKIRTTPALILIRDDLQGDHLLEEDMERGKLRVALECWKALEEEEANIHQKETKRIDAVVRNEVARRIGENHQVMLDMAALLLGEEGDERRISFYTWVVREGIKSLEEIPETFRPQVKLRTLGR